MERATVSLFPALSSGKSLRNCVKLKQEVTQRLEAEQAALGSSLTTAEFLGITQVFSHITRHKCDYGNTITCQKYNNEIQILTSGNLAEAGEEGDLAAVGLLLILIVLLELLLHLCSPGLLVLRSPGLFTHITKLTFQL